MAKSTQTQPQHQGGGWMKRLLAALAIFAGVALLMWLGMGIGSSGGVVDYRDAALVTKGKTLFLKNCVACHGVDGVGENARFSKGGAKVEGGYWAPALNGTAHTWHHPPDALFRIVKEGSPARDSPMVGWGDRLSDPEIHSLLAYLQSLWPETLRRRYDQSSMGK